MNPAEGGVGDIGPEPESANQGRTVALLAGVEAASKVASFLMFMAATRLLTVAEFGLFAWALSLSLIPVAFAVWGFGDTLIQKGSADRPRIPTLLSEATLWRLLLGIPVVAVLALPIWGHPEYRLGLLLVGIASLADSFNELIRGAAGAMMRQRAVALNMLVQRVAVAVLVVCALLYWPSATVMAAAYCAGTLLGVTLMFATAARIGLAPRPSLITRSGMKVMWDSSHAVGGTGIFNTLTFRSDTVLLAWLSTLTATGIYAAAYRLFETALFIIWSLIRVTTPRMAATVERPALLRLISLTPTIALSIFLPYIMVLVVRGGDVLTLFFGSQYEGTASALTMAVLGLALAPYALQFLMQTSLISQRLNQATLIGSAIALSVNVAFNLAMIPALGPVGAAAGTLIAMVAQWLYLRSQVRSRLGAAPVWSWIWPALLAAMAMIPALVWVEHVLVAATLGGLVYVAMWALLYRRVRPDLYELAAKVVRNS